MKRKTLIIFSIIFILILIGGIYYFGIRQAVVSRSTFLSISDASVVDSGKRILITGTVSGAENLNIFFNKDKINDKISDEGYKINSIPSSLKINMTDPSREFPVTKNNNQIFYKFGTYSLNIFRSCKNNLPNTNYKNLGRVGLTTTCIFYYSNGVFSTFPGTQIDNNEVKFELDGNNIGSLNPSEGTNTIKSNDGKIEVQWTGNLMNFKQITTPSSFALLFEGSKYSKMIKYSSWSDSQDALNSYYSCIGSSKLNLNSAVLDLTINLFSSSNAQECINNYNNKINSILVDQTSSYRNSVNAENVEFTNNGLKVFPSTPSSFPIFKIFLDAESVELERLSGKPEITSCSRDLTINSGDTSNINLQVKNVGNNDGYFFGDVSCSGSSNIQKVAIASKIVEPDNIGIFRTQIAGINSLSGTQSNECTITINDLNSDNSDTCTFYVGVTFQENIICSPNSITCLNSNTLKKCDSEGLNYELEDCENGCIVLESGEAQCKVSEDSEEKVCNFYESINEYNECKINILVWIILGLIIVILLIISYIKIKNIVLNRVI